MSKSSQEIWENLYKAGEYAPVVPYAEMLTFIVRTLGKQGEGKRIFEVGCGTAQNLAFAAWAMAYEIHGIDYSETAIAEAQRIFAERGLPGAANLCVGDASATAYPDGYFDAVMERAVLQQNAFPQGMKILGEMIRILRPGGFLCCSLAAEGHMLYGQGEYRGGGDFFNVEHDGMRHFFSRRDVQEAFGNVEILRWSLQTRQDVLSGRVMEQFYSIEARKPER